MPSSVTPAIPGSLDHGYTSVFVRTLGALLSTASEDSRPHSVRAFLLWLSLCLIKAVCRDLLSGLFYCPEQHALLFSDGFLSQLQLFAQHQPDCYPVLRFFSAKQISVFPLNSTWLSCQYMAPWSQSLGWKVTRTAPAQIMTKSSFSSEVSWLHCYISLLSLPSSQNNDPITSV